jgi:hypothetical protein
VTYQGALRTAPPRRRWTYVASALAAVALALAGCSSSSDDTSTSASASASSTAAGVDAVVDAANAFLGTLTAAQTKIAQLEFTKANAVAWSNLPCGTDCRPGLQFGKMTDAQLTAAELVLQKAMGTGTGSGFDQAKQIMLADGVLNSAQSSGTGSGPGAAPSGSNSGGTPPSGGAMPSGARPSGAMPSGGAMPGGSSTTAKNNGQTSQGYGTGVYFIGFLGTPSKTGTWELSFGGHHLAVHLTYKDGKVVGTTPFFIGVEPKTWTDKTTNTTYTPLATMHDGMEAMLKGLTSTELAKAKLSETYTDVLLGPGQDGKFPATKVGIPVSSLTAAQKQLVLTAIKPWVSVAADSDADALMKEYEAALDKTYVAWSGQSTLTHHADYVRVDGPGVWVEFVCQNGVVYQNQIHYHTVYRDHTRDYGGEFSF